MKHLILTILLSLYTITSFASTKVELVQQFEQANALYDKEQYDKAITAYLQLVKQTDNSPELYYNLANAYYKVKDNVNAVYYYEKALKLGGDTQQIQTNLNYARANLQDDILVVKKYNNQDIIHQSLQGLSVDQWGYLTTGLVLILCIVFVIYYQSNRTLIKRITFTLMLITSLGIAISAYAGYFESTYTKDTKAGIIFDKQVDLKQQPRSNSQTLLELRQGAKVYILDQKSLWIFVKLDNQETGWILKSAVKDI